MLCFLWLHNISQCSCNFCNSPWFCLVFKSIKYYFLPLLTLKEGCAWLQWKKCQHFFCPKKEVSVESKKRTNDIYLDPCWRREADYFPAQTNPEASFCFSSRQHCSWGEGGGKKILQWTVVLEIYPCSASKSIPRKKSGEGRPIQQGKC